MPTTEDNNIPMEQNRKAEEYDKLVEGNRRLQNQVISLQANVKHKKKTK